MSYSRTRISKITYFNDDKFDIGIVNDYSDDYISFVDFNIFGEYNGYILQSSETIEAVTHKGQYINFLPDCLRILNKGGLLVSDNVLQDGDVIESRFAVTRRDRTIHARMREYLYELKHNDALNTVILTVGDGMTLSLKL